MAKISSTLASNFIVAGAGRLIGGVFAFGATALIARALGPHGFGEYATVTAFLYIFNAIADFGLYSFLVREISKNETEEKELINQVLSLRMSILVLLLVAGVIVGNMLPYSDIVKKGFLIASFSYFFLSSAQVLMGIFQKRLVLWQATFSEIAARAVQFSAVLYLFFLNTQNILIFLGILAAASFVNFILVLFFASRYVKIRPAFSVSKWTNIIKQSLPIALSLIFTLIYFRLDTVLLSLFKSQNDVGIYNLAYKLLENIIFYPAMLVGLLMPILSKTAFVDEEKFKKVFENGAKILIIAALPMFIGGVLLAQEIIYFLGGSAFKDAAEPFKILLGATFFIFFGTIFGATVIALNKQKEAIAIYFIAMFFNVATNIIFIPSYGYMATATTTLITEIIVTAGLGMLIFRKIAWPSSKFIMKVSLCSAIMATPIIVWNESLYRTTGLYALFFWLILSPIVYGLSLFLTKSITKQDLKFFFEKP